LAAGTECGDGEPGRFEWTVENDGAPLYRAVFTARGGTLACFQLLNDQYKRKEEKPLPAGVPAWLGELGPNGEEVPLEMVSTWDTQFLPFAGLLGEEFGRDVRVIRKVLGPTAEGIAAGWKVGETRSETLDLAFRMDPVFTPVSTTPDEVVYVWPDPAVDGSDVFVERSFKRGAGGYRLLLSITIYNFGTQDLRAQPEVAVAGWEMGGQKSGMFSPPPNVMEAVCLAGGDVARFPISDLIEDGPQGPAGQAAWAAVGNRYFLGALVPLGMDDARCHLSGRTSGVLRASVYRSQQTPVSPGQGKTCAPGWYKPKDAGVLRCKALADALGVPVQDLARAAAGESAFQKLREAATPEAQADWIAAAKNVAMGRGSSTMKFEIFVGPKDISALSELGVGLEDTIDFWVVGFLAKPMLYLLRWFYSIIPHWAIAIVLLTIVVKLVLLYWTQKSYEQMQRMAQLKPAMEALKEKYGNDKERLNQEIMNLYKREKVSPLGGCLPMLLQMPIWIALYRTIYSCVDLYQAPLVLWIQDLSAPDKYFVLPGLLGVSMFIQQKMTPTTMDSAQAKMMLYIMPIMFTVFMLFLPSGLNLYIFVNTLLSMLQQYYLRKKAVQSKPAVART